MRTLVNFPADFFKKMIFNNVVLPAKDNLNSTELRSDWLKTWALIGQHQIQPDLY